MPASGARGGKKLVAVVGMACYVPGARTPEEFWKNVLEGEAWPEARRTRSGAARTRRVVPAGPVLEGIDQFDAEFFGIGPADAARTDPQHRLFLECAWEALESAGCDPTRFRGSIGVFAGCSLSTYLLFHLLGREPMDGSAADLAALIANDKDYLTTRLSYLLDLRGPSVGVQTACSSSLAAVHLACQSLLANECDLALAGGASIRVVPEAGYPEVEGGYLSPTGRCMPFDEGADGAVFGDGVGLVALRRLDDAIRDRDVIDAVIRATAINNDGARKVGFTAPSLEGQAEVIAEALALAGVGPRSIAYVETHGTGTPLGDAVEVAGLAEALRKGGDARWPTTLGSAKATIGHLECAAGIAGLIRAIMAVGRGVIPPTPHHRRPGPELRFAERGFRVAACAEPWPPGTRIAAVSSFGIGGTNANVIVAEPPSCPSREIPSVESGPWLLPVSARSDEALSAAAGRLGRYLFDRKDDTAFSFSDVVATASLRRAHHPRRLAVHAHSIRSAAEALREFETIGRSPSVTCREGGTSERPLVFVFSGQGGRIGPEMLARMGRFSAFRREFEACLACIRDVGGPALGEWLDRDGRGWCDSLPISTLQPLLFAVQVSLATLWSSLGIEPDVVIGHSLGEVAAARISNALSLEQSARVAVTRSRLLEQAAGRGLMAAVGLGVEEARREIAPFGGRVAIAAVNAPRSVVVSGDREDVRELMDRLRAGGVDGVALRTSGVAGHSPHVDRASCQLRESLDGLRPGPVSIPMISTARGRPIAGEQLDASYWAESLRGCVRFAEAVSQLVDGVAHAFLEVGPQPQLVASIAEIAHQKGGRVSIWESVRDGEPWDAGVLRNVARHYVAGGTIHWDELTPSDGRFVRLPGYPWQRKRHWLEVRTGPAGDAPGHEDHRRNHWLGPRFEASSPEGTSYWDVNLDTVRQLSDQHRVKGASWLPAACTLALVIEAARSCGLREHAVCDVEFLEPFAPASEPHASLQLVLRQESSGEASFALNTRRPPPDGDVGLSSGRWRPLVKGRLRPNPERSDECGIGPTAPNRRPDVRAEMFYEDERADGIDYGPDFRVLAGNWVSEKSALGRLESRRRDAATAVGGPDPTELDGCLQVAHAFLRTRPGAGPGPWIPASIESLSWRGGGPIVWCAAAQEGVDGSHLRLSAWDEEGRLVFSLHGLRVAGAGEAVDAVATPEASRRLEVAWDRLDGEGRPGASRRSQQGRMRWLVLADEAGLGERFADRLRGRGDLVSLARGGVRSPEFVEGLSRDGVAPMPLNILDFHALDHADPAARADIPELERGPAESLLDVIQVVLRGPGPVPRLFVVTRGACRVLEDDRVSPAQSAVWGLSRVVAHEHPELRRVVVDLDPAGHDGRDEGEALLDAIDVEDAGEDELALRRGSVWAPRLRYGEMVGTGSAVDTFRAAGAWLITGGLGGLGLATARWLSGRGATALYLVGRRAPSPETLAQFAEIEALGARVFPRLLDVRDRRAMEEVIREASRGGDKLEGVVHAAGLLADGLLADLDPERWRESFEVKACGGANLDALTRSHPVAHFVLYSSVAALIGSPAQGSHAAACSWLDGLAHRRNREGLPALSVNWGPWLGVGKVGEGLARELSRRGLTGLSQEAAFGALGRLLAAGSVQAGVTGFDLGRWTEFHPGASSRGLFRELGGRSTHISNPRRVEREAMAELPHGLRLRRLEAQLAALLGDLIPATATPIPRDRAFRDLGLDSLRALEFRNRIDAALGTGLSMVTIWRRPTLAQLALHLDGLLAASPGKGGSG